MLACRYLCKCSLSLADITIIDGLLMQFCRKVEQLYGRNVITPNMHMHGHLRENLLDYGPVYAFWLFSFERYNGVLGKQATNNRNIESQLLEHFIEDTYVMSFELPTFFSSEFSHHFHAIRGRMNVQTPSSSSTFSNELLPNLWSLEGCQNLNLPKCSKYSLLTDSHKTQIVKLYQIFYPSDVWESNIVSTCFEYASITMNNKTYSSQSGSRKNSIVMIDWNTTILGPPKSYADIPETASFTIRPVVVCYYIKHSLVINNITTWHMFAVVSWLVPHPKNVEFGKPVTVWCKDLYDNSISSIVPVQFLSNLCVYAEDVVDNECVVFVTPLID